MWMIGGMKITYQAEKNFESSNYDYFYTNTMIHYEKNKTYKKYKKFNLPDGIIYEYLAKDYFIIISGLIVKKEIFERKITSIKNLISLVILIL